MNKQKPLKKYNYDDSFTYKPATLRLGLIFGIFLYGIFGILDVFMLPQNYKLVLGIRFLFIVPMVVLVYFATYTKLFFHYKRIILYIVLSFGQLGIIGMIWISKPEDPAFHAYYAGLILVILWANFVFNLKFKYSFYIAFSTVILYNATVFLHQKDYFFHTDSNTFALFLSNNFFLCFAAILTLIGAYQLDKNKEDLLDANNNLMEEKKQLKKAKEKAEEADKLKSAFLANMSHEIRTPMNGILGFTNLLQQPGLTGEEQTAFIEIIKKSGDRMLSTVNDLIDISKIETGQAELSLTGIDLNEELNSSYNLFTTEAKRKKLNFELTNLLPSGNLNFKTDVQKFNSILTNLIKNALKYTDNGSIEIFCEKQDGHFFCSVTDTGIGIPKNRQQAVFDRFVQADIGDRRAFEGSGLGLSISKAYVELLGGKIWLDSEDGKGSVFSFFIPWQTTNNIKRATEVYIKDQNKLIVNNKKLIILIAEDDKASFLHLSIVLKNIAAKIIHATSGKQAVQFCKDNPDINLVLMDIKMPIMDGYEATRKIREFNPRLIIIAQTAYALSGEKDLAAEAGCNDYISKPINKEKLLGKIEKWMSI